jgi:hydrogenase/urease accessory protein HupE
LRLQTNQQPFDVIAQLWLQPPPGASARIFKLNYSVIIGDSKTHNAFISVRNDWDTAVFSGQPEPLGNLHYPTTSLYVDRSHGSWWQGFRTVFNLGLHHIAEGTDHLLFLLALLLPAPLLPSGKRWGAFAGIKRSLVQLLKIVSAFTVGHSLTLIIGALGLLRVPTRPVEILIAVSILISALHAIRPLFAGREMWIAAGFGLIHGLAFASGILEYGFPPWYLASTILGFNLGIEVMQLAVVAAVIPWLILLARTRFYSPVRVEGAVFAAVAASGWIAQRAFNCPNPFDPLVNFLAAHPLCILTALAATALSATAWECLKQRPAHAA